MWSFSVSEVLCFINRKLTIYCYYSIMEGRYMLPEKYVGLGFELSKLEEKPLILKYRGNPVFIFSSCLDIQDIFLAKLCEYYLISIKAVTVSNPGPQALRC
jgi:hypothetical protein